MAVASWSTSRECITYTVWYVMSSSYASSLASFSSLRLHRTYSACRYTSTTTITRQWANTPSRTPRIFFAYISVSFQYPSPSTTEVTSLPNGVRHFQRSNRAKADGVIAHCLDTVRQVLMCNFDTGVLGQVWVDPKKPHAFPDFRTTHVCKNYDEVREWARKLQAPPTEECPEDFLAAPRREDILKKTP